MQNNAFAVVEFMQKCMLYISIQKLRPYFQKKLVTLPMPDNNNEEDHYLYEILTFTGNWAGSSCDSGVSFVLTGENEQTPIRVLDAGRKDTLRKGTVDSYLMKTPRKVSFVTCIKYHERKNKIAHY